jgi:Fe-S cluster assembly iron-binding protein IscA
VIAITEQAATAIRTMTSTRVYPEAGLRITQIERYRFVLNLIPHPAEHDVKVDTAGARVYLDREAARALDRATLDTQGGSWSADQFTLRAG